MPSIYERMDEARRALSMNTSADCWKTLDLSATADERTLKRQYAKLPKLTRPDDDPVAFQRLREAYEQALNSVPVKPGG